MACHHPENFADQAPQDTVLLTAAREAEKLVGETALRESAETSAAVAATVSAEAVDSSDSSNSSESAASAEAEAEPEAGDQGSTDKQN